MGKSPGITYKHCLHYDINGSMSMKGRLLGCWCRGSRISGGFYMKKDFNIRSMFLVPEVGFLLRTFLNFAALKKSSNIYCKLKSINFIWISQ